MMRYLLALFVSLFCVNSFAQDGDSLFAVRNSTKLIIWHTMKPGENLKMLAHRFYVTERELEVANMGENERLRKFGTGDVVDIPVMSENYFSSKPTLDGQDIHELYYRVGPKDDIGLISTYAGVTKATIRAWNNMHGYSLSVDQVLFIGWIRMVTFDTGYNPKRELSYPTTRKQVLMMDTVRPGFSGGLDTIYGRQTNGGLNVLTEKGTAVFFEKAVKNNVYLAFHNGTPRGTIIKVTNPGSGKIIFVKVLGPIPDTKLYANCIIGICDAAKEALGITDSKAWCELSYPAN